MPKRKSHRSDHDHIQPKKRDMDTASGRIIMTRATKRRTETAAGTAVLSTSELLENILWFLPMKDLLLNQRVSRKWKSVVEQSPCLQQSLFFRHTTPDFSWLWSSEPGTEHVLTKVAKDHVMTGKHDRAIFPAGVLNTMLTKKVDGGNSACVDDLYAGSTLFKFNVETMLDHPNGSWRRMLPCQSPVAVTQFHDCERFYDDTFLHQTHTLKIGSTMDDFERELGHWEMGDGRPEFDCWQASNSEDVLLLLEDDNEMYRIVWRDGSRFVQASRSTMEDIEG